MPPKKFNPFKPVKLNKAEKRKIPERIKNGVRGRLSDLRNRKVFAIKKGVLATERVFKSKQDAQKYIRLVKRFEKFVLKNKPQFELVPNEFFHVKDNTVIERVFTGVSFEDMAYNPRYLPFLKRRVNGKINHIAFLEEIRKATVDLAIIRQLFKTQTNISLDIASNNIIILDYNTKTKKVVLAFVDILHDLKGGSLPQRRN